MLLFNSRPYYHNETNYNQNYYMPSVKQEENAYSPPQYNSWVHHQQLPPFQPQTQQLPEPSQTQYFQYPESNAQYNTQLNLGEQQSYSTNSFLPIDPYSGECTLQDLYVNNNNLPNYEESAQTRTASITSL